MSDIIDLQAVRKFIASKQFPTQFANEKIVVAAWMDAAAEAGRCTDQVRSVEVTNELVMHLTRRGVSQQTMGEAFASTRNAFSPPLFMVTQPNFSRHQGPTIRAISKGEVERNKKYTMEVLRTKHSLAKGNTQEQKRIEELFLDLIMTHGSAIEQRNANRVVGQEMLQNMRATRNLATLYLT